MLKPYPRENEVPLAALGVRELDVQCYVCRHAVRLDVGDYDDDAPVPWFSPRMVFTSCGMIGALRPAVRNFETLIT
jgi:hypothetical protein